jgi:hypothetical protein
MASGWDPDLRGPQIDWSYRTFGSGQNPPTTQRSSFTIGGGRIGVLFSWENRFIPADPDAPFESVTRRVSVTRALDRIVPAIYWTPEQVLGSVAATYSFTRTIPPKGYTPVTDVPEPGTLGLALLALGGIALAHGRRRRG